ncbi:MAG: hypothetical protein K5682_03660 [Lachnospiraceae bacterium]|nr:hypothetical protein [Lachnospiraceae bacterium]
MAGKSYSTQETIYNTETSVSSFSVIADGGVTASCNGLSFTLDKGDAVGIIDLLSSTYLLDYTTSRNTMVIPYPFQLAQFSIDWCKKGKEYAYLFTCSACRQISRLLKSFEAQKEKCGALYDFSKSIYDQYIEICRKNALIVRSLPGDGILPFEEDQPIPSWIPGYYDSLKVSLAQKTKNPLFLDPGFQFGLLGKVAEDVNIILSVAEGQHEYVSHSCQYLIADNHMDLLDILTSIYPKLIKTNPVDAAQIQSLVETLLERTSSCAEINRELIDTRRNEWQSMIALYESSSDTAEEVTPVSDEISQELMTSLSTILDYSGADEALRSSFTELLAAYKAMPDRTSTEDDDRRLRSSLTEKFYRLYTGVVEHALESGMVPVIPRMFLYFGYVDPDLAGMENARLLYRMADQIGSMVGDNVHTFFDWLTMILEGEVEPCRNEFDMDYGESLRESKAAGKITEEEFKKLLEDRHEKMLFELHNFFVSANKITYGKIATFCPVLSEHDVIRNLDEIVMTKKKIQDALDKIRSYDFSAYFHQTILSNPGGGITKEYYHVEILPNFILMPNIGFRPVMWQEIEGRKRTSPARMALSIFQLEDPSKLINRLTAEYRWEMCKREQGARWNDVTEASLTSEYFDYVQFYKKNIDLSQDAKDKIRITLQKAKNSYKEMFVYDYNSWIQFEGNGSPRLNKVARAILFRYCPFREEIRENLATNPLYSDMLNKYKILNGQKVHHITGVISKIKACGTAVPQELFDEEAFLNM